MPSSHRSGCRLSGLRLERAQSSRQFTDGRFRNTAPVEPGLQGNPLPVLGEFFFGGAKRTPPGVLPLESPLETWTRPPSSGFRVTWLGHSTLLLELDGARVLTDPVWGPRASPLSFAGPKRFHAAPVPIEALPKLDAVLVSHDHYDHLCRSTIQALAKLRVPFVTALGVGTRLEAFGVAPELITELDWWEQATVGPVSFTATPAQHFSGRGLGDRNQTLWASWVVRTDKHRVFFSGDTGLTTEFEEIRQRQGPFDLVMLEVGAWHQSWGGIHLGPENALKAHAMLGGGTLLPVHWGTFDLALHAWDEPAETLLRLATEQRVRLLTPRLGAASEPSHIEQPTPWWREVTAAEPALSLAKGC
ncbi:MBL fold metallo-hydrolase [Hyalangium minutum]|uniref:Outer membrane protein romA n=1 Tax=Hyalangium minutum TaxID=394096 RepID=A0A085WFQ3_9BACT|nr:MBL fold metallo-hydrolase [Hyalangium minutum]KFE66516.1 Outer membrane protein romA [Hyalangium minutum]